jgi:acyl-CoA thioester hydrolase
LDQPIETSRRFVNTWECDENAHLNVQFYYWHFEDAHVHFWYEAGWPASRNLPSIRHHHVRFHAELRVSDLMLIRSHLARTETGFALCHLMFNAETDDLAATCWCPLDDDGLPALVPGAPVMDPPEASQPRSLGPGDIPLVNRAAAAEAGYIETFRTLLKSSDCNAGGTATTKSLIAFQSDAAGHLWTHIGLDKDWLEANHFGRVAIESRISILSDIRPGTPLLIVTGLVGFATKTITFRHHTYDISAKSQVAVSEITGLAIDLDARRATSWPDELRKKLQSGLVKDSGN